MSVIENFKECPKCGDNHKGKPFCIYENGYHCFSCGYSKNADRSFTVRDRNTNNPEFPDSCSNPDKFQLKNLLWLNKYYITKEQIRKYNILEAPDGALILPTIENGEVVHYQKRYIQEKRVILSYGRKTPSRTYTGSSCVVIVEDYLSHIRVGEHCDTVCLYGTKASTDLLKSLLSYDKILVWLDNDHTKETNSGQEAAKNICNILEKLLHYKKRKCTFGNINMCKVVNIATDLDPKCYSNSELKVIIGESCEKTN